MTYPRNTLKTFKAFSCASSLFYRLFFRKRNFPLLKKREKTLLLILTFLTLAGVIPSAQALQPEKQPVHCKLVSSVTGTGAQDSILAGLVMDLEPGWKLYAPPSFSSNKDDFARHPTFEWGEKQNIKEVHVHWPRAEELSTEIESESLQGYTRSFILPLTLDLQRPHEKALLKGKVSMIACSTQCIPVTLDLSLVIPEGAASPTPEAEALLAARMDEPQSLQDAKEATSLLWILIIAFLGGALLNFMPCVLPVLSLKLRSFTHSKTSLDSGASVKKKASASFWGIMLSFWGLALTAILIERSGELFGWGLHFQSPSFLALMMILLLFFTKSLWKGGTFDLPNFLKQHLQTLLGAKSQQKQEWLENFLTGVFATLLATPCTAPFLGTALAYALSRGPYDIILLFSFMGLGFSFPYLILLIIPSSKLWLPKPGAWMEILSKIFSFLLMGTTLWLGWLLTTLINPSYALSFFSLLSLAFILGSLPASLKILRKLGALFLGGLIVLTLTISPPKKVLTTNFEDGWEPFDEAKIQTYLSRGKSVFVDVTASWCLTCQANKKLVLDVNPVKQALSSPYIIKMRADWTQPSTKIANYLKSFHRHGIPFNVFYSPNHPKGRVLPELLTSRAVLKEVTKGSTP